ncbi:kinase domain protein (macronuclear) [Tetrahymena thermophila SB210]|uniref:Kinase domain protein n=1 Tax=Tetrahymena thermophila (strain SB210) TaxID=312017 RepID=I7M1Q0_TETTS|nr:kinase domain protein [Tetrahymena thermophila SB210]EAR97323.2 kinase domain protein [Tetrahymena thermophila SB210]|eukprot:XP_001017568.2 kinase domain protein [Tetrahymena thermophila SB210]
MQKNTLQDLSRSLINDNIFISEKINTNNNNSNIQYYSGYNQEKGDEICIKQLFEITIMENRELKVQFEKEQKQFEKDLPCFLQKNYEYMESNNEEYYLISSPLFETIKQQVPMLERAAKGIFLQLIEAFFELHSMNFNHYAICLENIGYNNNNSKIQLQRFGFESHYIFRDQPYQEENMFLSPQYANQIYKNQRYSSQSQDMFNLGAIMQAILLGIPKNERLNLKLSDQLKELLESMTHPIEENRMKWENLLDHAYFQLGQSQPYEINRIQGNYNQKDIKDFYLQKQLNVSDSYQRIYPSQPNIQQNQNRFEQQNHSPVGILQSEDVQTVDFLTDRSQAEISFISIANQVMDEHFQQQPFSIQQIKTKKKNDESLEAKKQQRLSFQLKQGQMINEYLSLHQNINQNVQNCDINNSEGIMIFQQGIFDVQAQNIQQKQLDNTQQIQGFKLPLNNNLQENNQINKQNVRNNFKTEQQYDFRQNEINDLKNQDKISEGESFKTQSQQTLFNFSNKKLIPYKNPTADNLENNKVITNNSKNAGEQNQRFNTYQNNNSNKDSNNFFQIRENFIQERQNQQSPINNNINSVECKQLENPYQINVNNNLNTQDINNNKKEPIVEDIQNKLNSNNQLQQPESINKSLGNKKIVNSISASNQENEISISESRQEYEKNQKLMNQLTEYFMRERNKYSLILETCLLIYQQPKEFFTKKNCFENLINYAQLLNSLRLNYDLLSQLIDLKFQQNEFTPKLLGLYKSTVQYQNIYKLLFDDAVLIETWFLAAVFDLNDFKTLQMNSRLVVSRFYLEICSNLFQFVSKESVQILTQIFEAQQPANQIGEINQKWKLSKTNIEKINNLRKSLTFNFDQNIAIQLLDLQILHIKTGLEQKNSNISLYDVTSYKILYFLLYIKKHFNTQYVPQRIKLVNVEQNGDFDYGKFFDKINAMTDYVEIKKLISEAVKEQDQK